MNQELFRSSANRDSKVQQACMMLLMLSSGPFSAAVTDLGIGNDGISNTPFLNGKISLLALAIEI